MPSASFEAADLTDLAAGVLLAAGATEDAASLSAELLVRAELAGHGSHGLRLLPHYVACCNSGMIDPASTPTVERDDGATVTLDGGLALGQVAGMVAIDLAVDRARAHGVAVVVMRRSGHLGRLADYVERAASRGAIAIAAANDSGLNQVVAPYGSTEPRLATNPIAIGIPRAERPHLVLDMSTSVVSHGTLDRMELEGRPIPDAWRTGDALQPLGGPKGTGLALAVDVLAGILSGAGFSGHSADADHQGVWMVAIEPTRFLAAGALEDGVEQLIGHVHTAAPHDPGAAVLVPGEPAARSTEHHLTHGIPIPPPLWADLVACATAAAVPVPDPIHAREEQP